MCGIVGGIAERNVVPILLAGLKRLEYRGYDSAGIATIKNHELNCLRVQGKVQGLACKIQKESLTGNIGIAHTRWATHGAPSEQNAHPHTARARIAIVHNGIIENFQSLKAELTQNGYTFTSQTDTEVIAASIAEELKTESDLMQAVLNITKKLQGDYALGVIDLEQANKILAVRCGSPLVIGQGIGEHFIASDPLALESVAEKFLYLEEGEIACVQKEGIIIWDNKGNRITRDFETKQFEFLQSDKGTFRHFMQKEIFEQPLAIEKTLKETVFCVQEQEIFAKISHIQIIACGTSFYAGLIAKTWFESMVQISCDVDIASEFRYRKRVAKPNTLVITISQSGETADTLAALRGLEVEEFVARLCVCNVAQSTLVRESDLVCLTKAGPEIGVASTKAFTTQLVVLLLLTKKLAVLKNNNGIDLLAWEQALEILPKIAKQTLLLDQTLQTIAKQFEHKNHALFLGRGIFYPVALEGALKLKEISYIHAEAYPAGELKHGPLALVDDKMPVIVIAPNNELLKKIQSNIQEVRARGGQILMITDIETKLETQLEGAITVLVLPKVLEIVAPIIYTIPLQLLAYHVAVLKGTDVDQPRNLAKSVTVE